MQNGLNPGRRASFAGRLFVAAKARGARRPRLARVARGCVSRLFDGASDYLGLRTGPRVRAAPAASRRCCCPGVTSNVRAGRWRKDPWQQAHTGADVDRLRQWVRSYLTSRQHPKHVGRHSHRTGAGKLSTAATGRRRPGSRIVLPRWWLALAPGQPASFWVQVEAARITARVPRTDRDAIILLVRKQLLATSRGTRFVALLAQHRVVAELLTQPDRRVWAQARLPPAPTLNYPSAKPAQVPAKVAPTEVAENEQALADECHLRAISNRSKGGALWLLGTGVLSASQRDKLIAAGFAYKTGKGWWKK